MKRVSEEGRHSAGVKRQYSGTAGRIENSQIGVFLCYAGKGGSSLLDRELYVPQEWIEDRERCREAGIPERVESNHQAGIGAAMIERTLDAGTPCGWVTGDEVYGHESNLHRCLEARRQAFALAVASGPAFVVADGNALPSQHRPDCV